jgi:hypothetical protein
MMEKIEFIGTAFDMVSERRTNQAGVDFDR